MLVMVANSRMNGALPTVCHIGEETMCWGTQPGRGYGMGVGGGARTCCFERLLQKLPLS